MNKRQLILKVRDSLSGLVTTRQTKAVVEAAVAEIQRNEVVTILGFGTFSRKQYGPRKGRNPKTGAALTIPARTRVLFRPGCDFKAALKGKK